VAGTVISTLRTHAPDIEGSLVVWQWVEVASSLALATVLFAIMYKVLPDAIVSWRDAWVGGIMTAVLVAAGRYLPALYLTFTSVGAFGAAASLVVVLVWIFLTGLLLIYSVEFTQAWGQKHGRPVRPREWAEEVVELPAREAALLEECDLTAPRPPSGTPATRQQSVPPPEIVGQLGPSIEPRRWRRWRLLLTALAAAVLARRAARQPRLR
jgi:hypothetical protein